MDNVISFLVNLVTFGRRKQRPAHPSIRFHAKCGYPVELADNNSIAIRRDGYEDGIVFSQKPIPVNQPISIEVLELSPHKGTLFIGFTSMNPDRISKGNMCTDRVRDWSSRKNVVWTRGLFLHELKQKSVVSFYVDATGVVKHTVDGSPQEVLLQIENPSRPLWAVMDVYGSISAIKLVDVPVQVLPPDSDQANNNVHDFYHHYQYEEQGEFRLRRSERLQQRERGDDGGDQEVPVINLPLLNPFIEGATANSAVAVAGPSQMMNNFALSPVPLTPATPANRGSPSFTFHTPASPGVFGLRECIICMNDEADTAFIKCGHLCMCNYCADEFTRRPDGKLCPYCRAPITSLLRTYAT